MGKKDNKIDNKINNKTKTNNNTQRKKTPRNLRNSRNRLSMVKNNHISKSTKGFKAVKSTNNCRNRKKSSSAKNSKKFRQGGGGMDLLQSVAINPRERGTDNRDDRENGEAIDRVTRVRGGGIVSGDSSGSLTGTVTLVFSLISALLIGALLMFLKTREDGNGFTIWPNHTNQATVQVAPGVIIHPSLKGNGITLTELEQISENGGVISHPQDVYRHAQRRLADPLLAPERSNPRMSPFSINVSEVGIPINEPTRGESGPYQQVGYLRQESSGDDRILPLYGRQVYPGSHKWTYYTSTDQYHRVKVPITIDGRDCSSEYGCDEMQGESNIEIPAYPGRKFTATIYSLDAPRYIPFI